jgi:exodeoxyribonuclease-3
MNVAPEDRDTWDPEFWRGQILFSDPEKAALRKVIEWGLTDALRIHHPEGGLLHLVGLSRGSLSSRLGIAH